MRVGIRAVRGGIKGQELVVMRERGVIIGIRGRELGCRKIGAGDRRCVILRARTRGGRKH